MTDLTATTPAAAGPTPEVLTAAVLAGLDLPPIDLGLPPGSRVVVAMSGGVDSSVTAALVAAAGYETIGVTLQLYDHAGPVKKAGSCCAGQDVQDAREVANRLGIPYYVLDYESRFREAVMVEFADGYARGETPIPCVRCNQRVKFADLLETARDLGAAALATGHYARRVVGTAGPELLTGAETARDQSYFLFATTSAQLDFLRFPLGHMPKAQVREVAQRLGLPVATKPDSQDICFVPNGNYADIVRKLRPDAAEPGDIVHVDGRRLGGHAGIIHYTVGQRRGLNIAAEEALYVVGLDAAARRVLVGPRSALGRDRVTLKDSNWLRMPGPGELVRVKLRSAQPAMQARVHAAADGSAEILLLEPAEGIAPGQACVVYDGAQVLGGGWIRSTASSGKQAA